MAPVWASPLRLMPLSLWRQPHSCSRYELAVDSCQRWDTRFLHRNLVRSTPTRLRGKSGRAAGATPSSERVDRNSRYRLVAPMR